jgi:type I restriction enzyme, S subunit
MRNNLKSMSGLIEEIAMGPFGSDIKVENFVESGFPVLNGSNLSGVRLIEEQFKYVTPEKAKTFKKSIAHRGDIVITHRGTLGQICFIPNNSKFASYAISQSQFRVALNRELVDSAYFVYYFHTNEGQKRLLANKCHVGVPALAQATTNFRLIQIPLPSLATQQKIATVLSTLDAKIELNHRINAELEALAKTLYDYWFVQFDFPNTEGLPYKSSGGKMVWNEDLKREIPEGWAVEDLGNHIEIERGISYKSSDISNEGTPMINLNSFFLNGTYKVEGIKHYKGKATNKTIHVGDLLIATTDVTRNADIIGKSFILPDLFTGQIVASCDIAKVSVSEKLDKHFLDMMFKSELYHKYIKGFASGTLVLHLNTKGIEWYKCIVPPKELLNQYATIKENIEHKKGIVIKENQTLTTLRDWLLPMLMNGQVTVQ